MKELRVLTVTFEQRIGKDNISAFRGALVEKVGIEHEWFHNHNNDSSDKKYHYRYPLIQYKLHKGKPMLVFLDECIEEAQKLFAKADWTLSIKNQRYDIKIDELQINQFKVGIFNQKFNYHLDSWLPITQSNYAVFNEKKYLSDRIQYLEKKLANHIIAFSKGVECRWEGYIDARILNIDRDSLVHLKGNRLKSFNLDFETNYFLPNFIGLGKSVSRGFGVVTKIE